jgi:hypothetical protein
MALQRAAIIRFPFSARKRQEASARQLRYSAWGSGNPPPLLYLAGSPALLPVIKTVVMKQRRRIASGQPEG